MVRGWPIFERGDLVRYREPGKPIAYRGIVRAVHSQAVTVEWIEGPRKGERDKMDKYKVKKLAERQI